LAGLVGLLRYRLGRYFGVSYIRAGDTGSPDDTADHAGEGKVGGVGETAVVGVLVGAGFVVHTIRFPFNTFINIARLRGLLGID
jgi:hypothetical protein